MHVPGDGVQAFPERLQLDPKGLDELREPGAAIFGAVEAKALGLTERYEAGDASTEAFAHSGGDHLFSPGSMTLPHDAPQRMSRVHR